MRTKQGHQEEVSRGRRTTNHHWRVARKGSETGQKPETKQGRRESTGEECGAPRGKCTAKRRKIIWGKRGTNNVENRRRVQRRRRRKYV